MQAINLDTYNLSLLTAKEDILNSRSSTNWALFTYEGVTNNLKLSDSGAGGLTELAEKFHIAKPMYGLCRVGLTETGQPRIVMISWVGEDVDEYRRTECMSHVPAIKNFFKEAQVFISASGKDEVTEEKLGAVLAKVRPTKERLRRNSRPTEKEETVGTNYRKTNAAMEMRRINRDSFWARAEREEEERKEEERKKATEERRRLERERVLQERKEAEERDRKMEEKLQMIEEQKRAEAKLEEEAKKQEKTKWELQQREHEEEMRACLRRSESIEKAAEAAALISQRSMNPREFFRQLSSSSLSSSSPVSPRTGKPPFRRYQRSLTDTAFIFERASTASGGPTSPLSPSLTSPFSRTPASPFNRPTSPPSPGFRPVTSPLCPRMPVRSPPVSPAQRSAPPLSSLPNLPISRPPPPRSSPPGLPSSQASSQASAPPTSPGPAEKEPSLNPDAPSTALPENPVQFKDLLTNTMLSELTPEVNFKAEETLVEEDEEVVELEESYAISPPPSETKTTLSSLDRGAPDQPPRPHSEAKAETAVGYLVEVEEDTDEEPDNGQVGVEETERFHANQDELEPGLLDSDEPTLVENPEEEIEEEDTNGTEVCGKPSGNGLIDKDKPDQNGLYLQNGTAHWTENKGYVDCLEQSTPERCFYTLNCENVEDEDDSRETEVASENGESPEGMPLLCVRALFDYQAEDDSELSFEPGDVISHVEMVDKSWWRGYSKDGRQGLFPANYVETI
ncbi:drebrin-like protein A isoform X2 [Electrophorus electricus]|uniref:drebrin-like protein A isoform X2 n=1 Tax=Electrophorus electricus TaxID=8005 RepID=UPI0015CFC274|nr:drebrin-like protein A isoform X2 [Electrophorus electricus]